MSKWAYLVRDFYTAEPEEWEEALNELGRDDWEITCAVAGTDAFRIIFKREKIEAMHSQRRSRMFKNAEGDTFECP